VPMNAIPNYVDVAVMTGGDAPTRRPPVTCGPTPTLRREQVIACAWRRERGSTKPRAAERPGKK
jgi:hypothetical protein